MAIYETRCVKCHRYISWAGKALPIPDCPHCATEKKEDARDVEQALAMVDDIRDLCDQIPDRGQEFAESVQEKASSIGQNIERNNRVTAAQWSALQNMLDGCERWISD